MGFFSDIKHNLTDWLQIRAYRVDSYLRQGTKTRLEPEDMAGLTIFPSALKGLRTQIGEEAFRDVVNSTMRIGGTTPFQAQCAGGNIGSVKLLLPYVENVNARLRSGNTGLIGATANSQVEMIKYLCSIADEYGIDINRQDFYRRSDKILGNTALTLAVAKGSIHRCDASRDLAHGPYMHEAIDSLLEHGANPNIQTIAYGHTALHIAVLARDSHSVKALLDHGACLDILDDMGRTATDMLREHYMEANWQLSRYTSQEYSILPEMQWMSAGREVSNLLHDKLAELKMTTTPEESRLLLDRMDKGKGTTSAATVTERRALPPSPRIAGS